MTTITLQVPTIDDVAYYECWSPGISTSITRIIPKISYIVNYPADSTKHITLSSSSAPKLIVQWNDQTFEIETRSKISPYQVLFMIRQYRYIQNKKKEIVIHHQADLALFYGDTKGTRNFIHNAETKWLKNEKQRLTHGCIHFHINHSPTCSLNYTQICEYWDLKLRQVWEKFISKEIKVKGFTNEMIVPISYCINGIPVEQLIYNEINRMNYFSIYKGLSFQSYWKMDKNQYIEEEFFIERLKECLQLRKHTIQEYNTCCEQMFHGGKKEDDDD